MEIIELIKTEKLNEMYFIIARTYCLQLGKGYVHLQIDDIEGYIKCVKDELDMPPVIITYVASDINYDPNIQFVVKVNDDDILIFDKLKPRKIYYSRMAFGIELDYEFISSVKCINCGSSCKIVEHSSTEPNSSGGIPSECKCSNCSKVESIKCIFECTRCCIQYYYL